MMVGYFQLSIYLMIFDKNHTVVYYCRIHAMSIAGLKHKKYFLKITIVILCRPKVGES
jgi:hypothetical protein